MTITRIGSNATSVEFVDVTKFYRNAKVAAVNNVSMKVEAGNLVTLLGPSGCGKTTTLRMIAGLEMASDGRILIGGKDVTQLPATDRDVAMVFQSYALFPHMSVRENVEFGLRYSGVKKAEIADRAMAGLDLVGMADFGQRLPSQLSGGQQQRVAVARALVLEPQVLLFDEPLSNLDARLRRQVRDEIRDIQTKLGLTVIYVTHDQEEALAVSDRIIVMNDAVVAQDGAPRDLYYWPANAFVADFIGEANLLDCEVLSVTDGVANVGLGPIQLRLAARDFVPGPAMLAVRPDRLDVHTESKPGGLPGILRKATYIGKGLELSVETELGDVFAVISDVDMKLEPGQNVSVSFERRGAVLVNP